MEQPQQNTEKSDGRIAYGALCTWWGTIYEVGIAPSGLPMCPLCHGPLFEANTIDDWWAAVDRFDRETQPGYRRLVEYGRGKCFPDYATLAATYSRSN